MQGCGTLFLWRIAFTPIQLGLHIQQVIRVGCDGQEGIGVLEQLCFGPHASYGFKELLDGAS